MRNLYRTEPATEQRPRAEARLWQAVIVAAIQEWRFGPLRRRREAEHYLFKDDSGFSFVCQGAGMDLAQLRSKLAKLRGQVCSD
jgi:hypothetical protein